MTSLSYFSRISLVLLCSFSISLSAHFQVFASIVNGDRRAPNVQLKDQEIESSSVARIREISSNRLNVHVSSFNRIVMLTGEVPEAADSSAIRQAVASIDGVRHVVNELAVNTYSSQFLRSSDAGLVARTRDVLANAPETQSLAVKVVGARGTVYLMGLLTANEASFTVEIVRRVPGVQKVIRVFEILNDRQLADIQQRLAWAPQLTDSAEAERQKRQELEQRLAAVSRERERLAAEAQERERLTAEARERVRPALTLDVAPTIENAHALVIGNAAYPGSGRLDNPVNDATAISQKLRAMGFTVTTVTDANRQRLGQAMSQFRRTAASAEVSLLFYSGHGVQVFGKNYMLPTDVDQTDVAQATIQGVSLNEVVENFLPGKTKLVFLDACRDNPLQRTGDRSVSRGLAPIAVAEGTLIAYATKDGQVASDGTGQRNSPFTQALLEHLSDPADIAVVLRKVREKVMRATGGKQQPWEYGSLTGGELVLSAIRSQR